MIVMHIYIYIYIYSVEGVVRIRIMTHLTLGAVAACK